ncbi:MAG TPA: RNA polymerase sigma factor [Cytophagaceae bacterium]|nr:RNA polymerase sigma factor [Cytophagaceae bacterium]
MFFKKKNNFPEDNLENIIKSCLKQDKNAQQALIKLFFGYAKTISMRYAANNEDAEEIISDSFLKIFNHLKSYDHSLPFKAWLKTIVINTSIDHFRKNQKYRQSVDIDEVEIISDAEDIVSKISAEEILLLVQQLSPAYRMVFTLYVIEGYNHREIATMLGIKEGTSKSNLQDARRKLQYMIQKNHPHLYLIYAFKKNKINEN